MQLTWLATLPSSILWWSSLYLTAVFGGSGARKASKWRTDKLMREIQLGWRDWNMTLWWRSVKPEGFHWQCCSPSACHTHVRRVVRGTVDAARLWILQELSWLRGRPTVHLHPALLAEKPCNLRHLALIYKIFFAFVFLFHNAHSWVIIPASSCTFHEISALYFWIELI